MSESTLFSYLVEKYPQYLDETDRFLAEVRQTSYENAYVIVKLDRETFARNIMLLAEIAVHNLIDRNVDDIYRTAISVWNVARNRVANEMFERGDYTVDPETGELHYQGYPELTE